MIVDPRRNRFAMNMQLRQRFTRANPNRLKISQKSQIFLAFFIPKKIQRCSKQAKNTWLQKSQIGNLATQELRMRIKYARKHSIFVMYRSSENLDFLFPC